MKSPIAFVGTMLILFSFANCKKGDSNDDTLMLFLLYNVSNAETVADIYPDRGFPGSTTSLTGESFPGVASEYTVSVGGTTATGINLTNTSTLTFTMPTVPNVAVNSTLPIVVQRSGSSVLSKTIRYRPLQSIALNQPNSITGRVSSIDVSTFYSFTATTNTPHVANVFGYAGSNLDLYYYSSPTSVATALATGTSQTSEFDRATLAAGNYILQVKHVSGLVANFKTNISDGAIVPTSTSNEANTFRRCYDFLGSNPTANVAGGCESLNPPANANMLRTGRCTYPGESGLSTRSYYISTDNYGFTTGYAQTTCLQAGYDSPNPDKAIFIPN
ncbi:IPT/TIG domain-containing protein [Leptospira barantonii]|uniref:IPT/TIG domain-containing protein n=1 Tax=Leptospira barantonii TaxID=2023184 RepID=A0ABX4NFY8_9LEPT|nr:IPT/TIG domain-containing protein [Leptospira barantonii]PJZ55730.1 hypothetical protein CH367_17790 [Leptospira barantonii]